MTLFINTSTTLSQEEKQTRDRVGEQARNAVGSQPAPTSTPRRALGVLCKARGKSALVGHRGLGARRNHWCAAFRKSPEQSFLNLNVSLNHQGCGQNAGSDSADLESSGFCIFLTSSQVMGPLQVSRPTGAGGWSGSRVAKGVADAHVVWLPP